MDQRIYDAFFNEMELIKEAQGSYLKRGFGALKNLFSGKAPIGAKRAGGVWEHMKQIYRGGATPLGARSNLVDRTLTPATGGGVLGGLNALAKSRYGQMAAAGGLALGGTYGAYRLGKNFLGNPETNT